MPILPQEIRGKVQRRRLERLTIPDRLGEEGILHLVNFDDKRYFAKEWYTVSEKGITMPFESGGSPASPYWHKVKTYESHLIHAALPDLTLRVAASYDPRITKDDQGEYHFAYQSGRPVHLTPKVQSDPELLRQRDAIIGPTYQEMFNYHRRTNHGWKATPEERTHFYQVIAEADARLEALFGQKALMIPLRAKQPIAESVTLESAKRIADQTTVNDNGSGPAQMWKYGILPIHTHFNFIPEGKDHTGEVRGKYIELAIFDLNRYWQEFKGKHGDTNAKRLVSKIERYRLFRILDDLFDRIVWDEYKNSGDDRMHDPTIQTAVFQLLEVMRSLCEKHTNLVLDQLYQPILGETGRLLQLSRDNADLLRGIEQLTQRIKDLPIEYRRA